MNTIFETRGGAYIQRGDYLIPELQLLEKTDQPIGKYGRMRKAFLKEYRPVIYNQLILSEKLQAHLVEIDQACQERMSLMIQQMQKAESVTESLKAADQMEWVRRMNGIRARAEEIILVELVYA